MAVGRSASCARIVLGILSLAVSTALAPEAPVTGGTTTATEPGAPDVQAVVPTTGSPEARTGGARGIAGRL